MPAIRLAHFVCYWVVLGDAWNTNTARNVTLRGRVQMVAVMRYCMKMAGESCADVFRRPPSQLQSPK